MMWQLQSKFPQHRYHPVPGITCACNKCPHMARNTLEKLRDCLVHRPARDHLAAGVRQGAGGAGAELAELKGCLTRSQRQRRRRYCHVMYHRRRWLRAKQGT